MAEKVLVVEDEGSVRDLLSEFLSDEGYDVIVAADGREALELAKQEVPDLILLDLNMPKISGIEVCKKLKQEAKTRSIPVIVITGVPHTEKEAFEAGADDFVKKPFELKGLAVQVKSALGVGF